MRTTLAYTLRASGNSVEPGQVVLTKQLSQILRPDALLIFEKSRLSSGRLSRLTRDVIAACAILAAALW
ncbi:MAG: hypothetical protein ACRD3S_02025, partial [Terracidiphilus sp.]